MRKIGLCVLLFSPRFGYAVLKLDNAENKVIVSALHRMRDGVP
jgi:hypothetical protein